MPDDSSGIYSLPAGTIVSTGDTILPSQHNPWANDNANAMSNRFSKDGRAPATGNWNLNNFRITGLGTPTATTDAATKAYVDAVGGTAIANKSGNYTVVAGDNGNNIRFTVAATATLTAAATLGNAFRCRIIASNGQVLIDPNGSETINGLLGLTLNTGQTAYLFCDGSNFVAYVTGDTASGPQLQGYLYGLTATTNATTPSTNIDVAAGATASSAAPFYLLQLLSSITKNTNAAWTVGTGNGSLDTGAIANATYYGYLIQRSDTGVVDVLTSLSATAPTMPANYDRRSLPLFSFTRVAGVNTAPATLTTAIKRSPTVALSGSAVDFAIPAGVQRINLLFSGISTTGTSNIIVQIGDAGGIETSGYASGGIFGSSASAASISTVTGNFVLGIMAAATSTYRGIATLSLNNPLTSDWVWSVNAKDDTNTRDFIGAGSKTLSPGPLTTFRLTNAGADTFDAGTATVTWEF